MSHRVSTDKTKLIDFISSSIEVKAIYTIRNQLSP